MVSELAMLPICNPHAGDSSQLSQTGPWCPCCPWAPYEFKGEQLKLSSAGGGGVSEVMLRFPRISRTPSASIHRRIDSYISPLAQSQ